MKRAKYKADRSLFENMNVAETGHGDRDAKNCYLFLAEQHLNGQPPPDNNSFLLKKIADCVKQKDGTFLHNLALEVERARWTEPNENGWRDDPERAFMLTQLNLAKINQRPPPSIVEMLEALNNEVKPTPKTARDVDARRKTVERFYKNLGIRLDT